MVGCRQATSHYLNLCWPGRSTPYHSRRQCVKCGYTIIFVVGDIVMNKKRHSQITFHSWYVWHDYFFVLFLFLLDELATCEEGKQSLWDTFGFKEVMVGEYSRVMMLLRDSNVFGFYQDELFYVVSGDVGNLLYFWRRLYVGGLCSGLNWPLLNKQRLDGGINMDRSYDAGHLKHQHFAKYNNNWRNLFWSNIFCTNKHHQY